MNKNLKKVSVIMACYNSENTICTAIESIISQSYKNIEILVVDDNSTDNTFNILKKYIDLEAKVKVFKNESNIGLTKSLNFLLDQATGYYIARHDADDLSKELRIEKQVQYLESKNLDFCSSRALVKDTNRLIPGISHYIPKNLLIKYKNPFIHGTLFAKKTVFDDIGGYDEDFYFAQDYKLFKDLLKAKYKFKTINEPLYILNMQDNISSLKKDDQKYYSNCVKNNLKPIKK